MEERQSQGAGLLKIEEAARYATVSRSRAFKLIAAGEWPVIRQGRLVRVVAAGIDAWVQRKRAESVGGDR